MAWNSKKNPVYLIAEIGGNHEGDFEYAKKLAKLALESGVDAVKFQIYSGDGLVSPIEDPGRNQHFKRFELKREQHIELAQMCRDSGVDYNASVWIPEAIEWIDPYLSFYKIGSGDFTAYLMLRLLANTGKPLLLSTGLSTWDEVQETVAYILQYDVNYRNSEKLGLLQCTSMYPIPDSEANLKVMDTYREKFPFAAIGYSDHTEGSLALEVATARGAEILEFHFTDVREGKSFRDHKVSLTRDEVKALTDRLWRIKALTGSGEKALTPSEMEAGHPDSFRRAVYLNRDMIKGQVIQLSDLCVLRPNVGIDARQYYDLPGKTLNSDKKAFERLAWEDFE